MKAPLFRRFVVHVLMALTIGGAPAYQARADEPMPYAELTPVRIAELAETRGGMRVGAFDFDIGIAINTALDDGMDLTSRFQAIGGEFLRTTVSGPAEAIGGAVPEAVSSLPDGGIAWRAAEGLTVLHDPSGLGAATIFNTLDNQAIRQRLEINIRVTNFEERLGAIRTGRTLSSVLRNVGAGVP